MLQQWLITDNIKDSNRHWTEDNDLLLEMRGSSLTCEMNVWTIPSKTMVAIL